MISKNNFIDQTLINKKNWVKNLTSVTLSNEVIDTISLGPNFSTHKKSTKQEIIEIINIETSVQKLEIENDTKNEIREKVAHYLFSNVNQTSHIPKFDRDITKKLNITKNFL